MMKTETLIKVLVVISYRTFMGQIFLYLHEYRRPVLSNVRNAPSEAN